MKKYCILLAFVSLSSGCNTQKKSPSETVTKYYDAFDASDFERLRTLLDDSLTIIEGQYATTYSHSSFYEQFKWDSIFQPTYKVVEITEENNQVIATVASSSLRYEFLKNNPLTGRYRLSFNSGKISKVEILDYIDANWEIWQMERDSLVNWVSINHPELDGFIHDLSMNGAINYLKAIELYEDRKDAL